MQGTFVGSAAIPSSMVALLLQRANPELPVRRPGAHRRAIPVLFWNHALKLLVQSTTGNRSLRVHRSQTGTSSVVPPIRRAHNFRRWFVARLYAQAFLTPGCFSGTHQRARPELAHRKTGHLGIRLGESQTAHVHKRHICT